MPKYKILQEGASYTFRSYCEMNAEPEDILALQIWGMKDQGTGTSKNLR